MHEDEAPSPEAATITESSVILEFLADLFPDLLPADPVLRAKARFFIKTVDEKFSKTFFKFVVFGGSMDEMLDAVAEMQALLPDTGFAVGAWSIADAAFAPFLVRLESLLRKNFCAFADGVAEKTLTELQAPTFARVWRYLEENVARESMAKTWDEVSRSVSILTQALIHSLSVSTDGRLGGDKPSGRIHTVGGPKQSVTVLTAGRRESWKDHL